MKNIKPWEALRLVLVLTVLVTLFIIVAGLLSQVNLSVFP